VRTQSIQGVVLIFPGALGDLVVALPTLRALRRRHGGAYLTAVVREPLRSLVALTGVADATASLDGADATWLFGGARWPRWLEGRPFVYTWLGAGEAILRARLDAVAARVRYFSVERGPGATHAAGAYARAVGVVLDARTLAGAARIVPRPSPAADAVWAALAGPVLALHAGAGGRSKRWAAEGFAQLGARWCAAGGSVVTVAGPAEQGDLPVADGPVVCDWPLGDVAAVLARAAVYVGNDSGVSHLAGAVGARGVVLFGPTDPRRWRPLGTGLRVLRARSTGRDGIALAALPVQRVFAACRRLVTLTRRDLDTSVARAAGRAWDGE